MVRRWRLIGYFPILYNPSASRTPVTQVLYGYTKPIYAHDWDRGSLLQYQSFGLSTPSLLAGSSTPVLIVQGAQDQTVPASAALSLQRALGERAQLVQLERCGHLPMDECADRLNAVVLPFVARVMRRDDAAGPTQQLSVTEPVVVQRSPGQGVSK
jgi:pimeloyl-ACP methyl ester carboxylesterase